MFASLNAAAPATERTAAILGLTQLQQLHRLGFVPSCHAEVNALASAAEAGLQQLRSLTLLLPPRQQNSCSLASVCIAVDRMRQLRDLDVDLAGDDVLGYDDACALVQSAWHVAELVVDVSRRRSRHALLDAYDNVQRSGSHVPRHLHINVVDFGVEWGVAGWAVAAPNLAAAAAAAAPAAPAAGEGGQLALQGGGWHGGVGAVVGGGVAGDNGGGIAAAQHVDNPAAGGGDVGEGEAAAAEDAEQQLHEAAEEGETDNEQYEDEDWEEDADDDDWLPLGMDKAWAIFMRGLGLF
jgi:hypothetical protein